MTGDSDWVQHDGNATLHWLRVHDQRAQFMLDLLKAWGTMNILSDAMSQAHDQPHKKSTSSRTIDDLVLIAADTAEKAYDEIERRGWQLKLPGKQQP